jgi:hypothetical protein
MTNKKGNKKSILDQVDVIGAGMAMFGKKEGKDKSIIDQGYVVYQTKDAVIFDVKERFDLVPKDSIEKIYYEGDDYDRAKYYYEGTLVPLDHDERVDYMGNKI